MIRILAAADGEHQTLPFPWHVTYLQISVFSFMPFSLYSVVLFHAILLWW